MKTVYTIGCLLFATCYAFCQQISVVESLKADSVFTRPLTEAAFKQTLNDQFRDIITGRETSIGNYAALDTKNSKLSFTGSSYGKKSILTANVNAAVTNGVSALFSNTKLNTGVGINLKLHLLSEKGREVSYLKRDLIKSRQDSLYIVTEGKKDSMEYDIDTEKLLLMRKPVLNKIDTLTDQRTKYVLQKDSLDRIKSYGPNSTTANSYSDSLRIRILLIEKESFSKKILLDSINFIITNRSTQATKEKNTITNLAVKEANEVIAKITKSSFLINWFTVGYGLLNKSFSMIDTSKSFSQQMSKQRFVQHIISVGWNKYKWSRYEGQSHYFSINAEFSLDDNKEADLSEVSISESRSFTNTTTVRLLDNKYTAYMGTYRRDLPGLRLSSDYYKFLFADNVAAIHVFPSFAAQKGVEPRYNLGLGFSYRFKKEDDETKKAVVNTELYVEWQNLFYRDPVMSFFRRNEIGVRVAFPINFIVNN